jgi:hypothetical protein
LRRVFLDTEFTDFIQCDLISIGLKAETGEEFYGENLDFNKKLSSDFVHQAVYPFLTPNTHGMKELELSARLWQWFDDLDCEQVEIYMDYPSDWELMCELLRGRHPKFIHPVNIFVKLSALCLTQSVLSSPDGFAKANERLRKIFYTEFMNHFYETKEPQHHALSDARANHRGYLAAERELGIQPY